MAPSWPGSAKEKTRTLEGQMTGTLASPSG